MNELNQKLQAKVWVQPTFALVHLGKKVRCTSATSEQKLVYCPAMMYWRRMSQTGQRFT